MTASFLEYLGLIHRIDESAGGKAALDDGLRAADRATVAGGGGHHDDADQEENNESPLGA